MPFHTSFKVYPICSHLDLAAVVSVHSDSLCIQPGNPQASQGQNLSMLTAKAQLDFISMALNISTCRLYRH